jgi:hypothetical protein
MERCLTRTSEEALPRGRPHERLQEAPSGAPSRCDRRSGRGPRAGAPPARELGVCGYSSGQCENPGNFPSLKLVKVAVSELSSVCVSVVLIWIWPPGPIATWIPACAAAIAD